MSRSPGGLPPACRAAHELIHARLDGPIDSADHAQLEAHLASCETCRDLAAELGRLQHALAALPVPGFPDHALEAVWDRTVRARKAPRPPGRTWRLGALAAAAAVIGLLVITPVLRDRAGAPPRPPATDPDLLHAAEQVRFVFELTHHAIERTEQAAVHTVIEQELAPALGRVPLFRPTRPASENL